MPKPDPSVVRGMIENGDENRSAIRFELQLTFNEPSRLQEPTPVAEIVAQGFQNLPTPIWR